MKKLKWLFLVVFIFSIGFFFISQKKFRNSDNLITGKLNNGIHYYIYKNKKPENKAALNLVVNVGSLVEEDNEQGIAHFMEHMAFNGTTKYQKNAMIKYLESIGLNFGGDLNAYTSFNATVYKLLVPTTDSSLKDGIEVLKEWATEATIEEEEVQKEKKVIIEEWRLRQGLAQRLGDVQKKALFDESRYFDRYPIGLPEIINGANRDLLNNFYKKWYQPQNISVVAVGDFDVKKVENYIKTYFDYKFEGKRNIPKEYDIKKLSKDKYFVFSDSEIVHNSISIIKLLDDIPVIDEKSLKKSIVDDLLLSILNTRISNLVKHDNSPFLSTEIDANNLNNKIQTIEFSALLKNNRLEEGITLLNEFINSSVEKGISKDELKLEKENLINNLKTVVANKDSIEHSVYIGNIVESILSKTKFLDIDTEYKLYENIVPTITIQQLNERLKEIHNEKSIYFLIVNNKQNSIDKQRLKQIIDSSSQIKTKFDFSSKQVNLDKISIKPGTIIEKNSNIYKLSNGIKVYTKKTDFEKDRIYIHLFKREGSSVDNYDNFINLQVAPEIIQNSGVANLTPENIEIFSKGKNFSFSTYVTDYTQGLNIVTNKKDLLTSLDYMTATVYAPKVDQVILNNKIKELKEIIENRNNSPKKIYLNTIKSLYSGGNIRRKPLSEKDITLINKSQILNSFKEKFNNFTGYNMTVVGSFDEKELGGILEKYFASLPTTNIDLKPENLEINVPKGIVKKVVKKGIDKKSTVTLIFPYNSVYGYNEALSYKAFSEILNIILIEEIREKIGGVYSIGSGTTLSPNNFNENYLIISFSCDTKRIDEIKKAVFKTLQNTLYNKIPQEHIKSIVKNYELSYNTQIKKNNFWIKYLYNTITIDNYKIPTPAEYKDIITKENLWKYNQKAINLKNYIDVTLTPEKENL